MYQVPYQDHFLLVLLILVLLLVLFIRGHSTVYVFSCGSVDCEGRVENLVVAIAAFGERSRIVVRERDPLVSTRACVVRSAFVCDVMRSYVALS